MGEIDADNRAEDLSRPVGERRHRRNLATQREIECHRRIEMRAGERRENRDQNDQCRAGRDRIGEQCEGLVAACQAFRHDARADDRHQQERGSEAFGGETTRDHAMHLCMSTAEAGQRSRN